MGGAGEGAIPKPQGWAALERLGKRRSQQSWQPSVISIAPAVEVNLVLIPPRVGQGRAIISDPQRACGGSKKDGISGEHKNLIAGHKVSWLDA